MTVWCVTILIPLKIRTSPLLLLWMNDWPVTGLLITNSWLFFTTQPDYYSPIAVIIIILQHCYSGSMDLIGGSVLGWWTDILALPRPLLLALRLLLVTWRFNETFNYYYLFGRRWPSHYPRAYYSLYFWLFGYCVLLNDYYWDTAQQLFLWEDIIDVNDLPIVIENPYYYYYYCINPNLRTIISPMIQWLTFWKNGVIDVDKPHCCYSVDDWLLLHIIGYYIISRAVLWQSLCLFARNIPLTYNSSTHALPYAAFLTLQPLPPVDIELCWAQFDGIGSQKPFEESYCVGVAENLNYYSGVNHSVVLTADMIFLDRRIGQRQCGGVKKMTYQTHPQPLLIQYSHLTNFFYSDGVAGDDYQWHSPDLLPVIDHIPRWALMMEQDIIGEKGVTKLLLLAVRPSHTGVGQENDFPLFVPEWHCSEPSDHSRWRTLLIITLAPRYSTARPHLCPPQTTLTDWLFNYNDGRPIRWC